MSIESFLLTDQWKTPVVGDHNDTNNALLRQGITGTATVTAIIPPGMRVEDDPRAWSMLSRPMQGDYHLGRLIGPDGHDGIRLIGWVNGHVIAYKIERRLRYAGNRMQARPTITVAPVGETLHLPDAAPVDPADLEEFEELTVSLREALREATNAGTEASQAAAAAERSVSEASAHEKSAGVSARSASDSANAAEKSRKEAKEHDDEVRRRVNEDASRAETAATAANTSAGQSASAAGAADTSAGRAETAASAAEDAKGRAGQHEHAASGFADAASAARDGAVSARTGAESARDEAEVKAGAAAEIAAAEKIAELVGDAPEALDTIYELASALQDKGDALAAVQTTLDNRVVGAYRIVVQDEAPGADTPLNQITFVRGGI